jgi:hypothetical protein
VAHAFCVHAHYFNNNQLCAENLLHFIVGTALKDKAEDRRRLKYYFDSELSQRDGKYWRQLYSQRDLLY